MNNTISVWAAILIFISASVSSEENFDIQTCQQQDFVNSYHLIDVDDMNAVSLFYKQIGDSNFIDLGYISSIVGKRKRITTYYDFDDLAVLNASKEIIHIVDDNLPDFRMEREQVNYIDNQIAERNTISLEVKRYNKKVAKLDKHPLFSRIKRSDRKLLIDNLSTISAKQPNNLSVKLNVESTDIVDLINYYNIPIGSVTLSNFNLSSIGIPKLYSLLSFEIFNNSNTYLTKSENKEVNAAFCKIHNDFQQQFPYINKSLHFGYAEYYELTLKDYSHLLLLKKYPVLFDIGQILILTLLGFFLIKLSSGRYIKKNNYKKTTYSRRLK